MLDESWQFAFGNTSDPSKDFGAGTEHFDYFAKAKSIHNTGPYSSKFDVSDWKNVNTQHGVFNDIERSWKFYDERPYLCGLFYWTGFDYCGEPDPLSFLATGSHFGILDYCGFEKDEAYYFWV